MFDDALKQDEDNLLVAGPRPRLKTYWGTPPLETMRSDHVQDEGFVMAQL